MALTTGVSSPLSTSAPLAAKGTSRSASYIPSLDGLRGIAILLVLGHHLRFVLEPAFRLEHWSLYLLDFGWCGVNLFFVLSGFLITGILLDTKKSAHYFGNFYARRALRIFPLYYGYLAFVFVGLALWWSMHFHSNPWKEVNPVWYLSYLQNFKPKHMFNDVFLAHLWSLAIEEQFYLFWPLVVLLLSRASLGFVCILSMPAALITRLFFAGHGVQESIFLNTFTIASIDSLCAGALVAMIVRHNAIRARLKGWLIWLAIFGVIMLILIAKVAGSLFLYSVPMDTWGLSLLNIVFACFIFLLVDGSLGPLQRVLSLPPLKAIGKVSYGMYVLHPVVIGFVVPQIAAVPRGTPSWKQYLIKLSVIGLLAACTFLVASLSWIALERPFLNLKKFFQYVRKPSGTSH